MTFIQIKEINFLLEIKIPFTANKIFYDAVPSKCCRH